MRFFISALFEAVSITEKGWSFAFSDRGSAFLEAFFKDFDLKGCDENL